MTSPLSLTGVYQIRNLVSGKVYVGSAAKSFKARFQNHRSTLRANRHRSSHLQHAWNKYGEAAFVFEPLLICAPKDCIMFEQRTIDAFDAAKTGYNSSPTAKSLLGFRHTAESKKKISEGTLGRVSTPEMRLALSKAHTGKVISEAHRAAISKANKGRPFTDEHKKKLAIASSGRTHSDETKRKIGIATLQRLNKGA